MIVYILPVDQGKFSFKDKNTGMKVNVHCTTWQRALKFQCYQYVILRMSTHKLRRPAIVYFCDLLLIR
jgi:hypothetical protein